MRLKLTSFFSWGITRPLRQVGIGNLKAKWAFIKTRKIIRKSGLFDKAYYLDNYPDVKQSGADPLEHYLLIGGFEGRNPSPDFDSTFYLTQYQDVKESGINPLLHYIKYGESEGRQIQIKYVSEIEAQETFEKEDLSEFDISDSPVKTIAFYLPQFHPIPENDKWWGKGFTEWTNVIRSKPLYDGHYQPHLPYKLGFYDLRIPGVMKQQVEMASSFGINGFCFYYYRFGSKRLLEKPLDIFLEHPEWNIEFCVCWANENWTRRWDGLDKEVLIAQKHSAEDDILFAKNIGKYINDPRYMTIDGKPMIVIYRPQLFPDIKASVKRWRDYCKINYNKEVYLAMVQSFGKSDPNEFDFDAAIEFPPHVITQTKITHNYELTKFTGEIFDVKSIISNSRNKIKTVNYELFRGVMLNWDNTARRGLLGDVYLNNTPAVYESWLSEAYEDTIKHKTEDSKKIVFINAWNEWAEGTHLEPDQKYGYAYLNATKRAIKNIK